MPCSSCVYIVSFLLNSVLSTGCFLLFFPFLFSLSIFLLILLSSLFFYSLIENTKYAVIYPFKNFAASRFSAAYDAKLSNDSISCVMDFFLLAPLNLPLEPF